MLKALFRKIAGVSALGLVLSGVLVPVHGNLRDTVTAGRTLQQVATAIQNSTDTGVFRISFSSYKNVSQFKLDAPSARIDSLIFERSESQESDSVIRVDSTLFDIKRTTGTVVLQGLAFFLANPKAVLISGAEIGKENLHLIIDSCFIYADSLNGSFLNWAASNAGQIVIRHSFFVSRTGTVVTKLSVSGGKVTLQNNLFNFPGTVSPTVAIDADIKSNTFNRTQLILTGDPSIGIPSYNFSRNMIAHHGTASAIGSPNFWFAYISGLNNRDAGAINNRLYKTWHGFNLLDTIPFSNSNSNEKIDTILGKAATELWDWYTSTDFIAGFHNGPTARNVAYNVLPGGANANSYSWTMQSLAAKVYFQPSIFPKQINPTTDTKISAPISANPSIRFLQPASGALRFGSFRVDSISVAMKPVHGTPVLLTKDSSGVYRPQTATKRDENSAPSVFTNASTSARNYFLGFLGNTSRGKLISPASTGTDDSLLFDNVDSAGETTFKVKPSCNACPNDLRYLGKNFFFVTTAVLKDSLIFGLKDSLPALRDDSLYWMLRTPDRRVKAKKTVGPNRKVYAKVLAEDSVDAFLVEKLSVPKGGRTFTLADGTLRAEAAAGYQITVDSLAPMDKIHYGQFTQAYGYTAQGKLATDSVTLRLNWKPDQEAFQNSLGKVTPLLLTPDSAGIVKIALKPSDTGKTYFLAVKYNILADSIFNGSIEGGVILANFRSSTSAKSKFVVVPSSIRNNDWVNRDSAFKSTLFLTGKELKTNGAIPDQPWKMTFTVAGATNRDSVEAWWSDGKAWTQISASERVLAPSTNAFSIDSIPKEARYIVAVERLPPPETYIRDSVGLSNSILHVTVTYKGDTLNKAIDKYCVEMKAMDQYGKFNPPNCDILAVGVPATIPLNANLAYVYRLQYFTKGVRYGSPSYKTLEGPSWDRKEVLPPALSVKPENIWHLVGFPFKGRLAKSIVKSDSPAIRKGFLDTIVVMHIKRVKDTSIVDTLKGWGGLNFKSGDAFLVGGTRSFSLKMEDTCHFLPLQVVRIPLDSGWHFLANPFPTTLATNIIRSVKRSTPRFWKLTPPSSAGSQAYKWDSTASLTAFSGYAYFARSNDTLVIDLFADTLPAKPVLKATSWPTLVKVELQAPSTSAHMFLTMEPGEQNIPFLSTPASSIEMRVGGGSGYLLKAIPNLQALDESLVIRSGQNGNAAFSLGLSPEILAEANVRIRLIDLSSGKVYAEPDLAELPLNQGTHTYRLLVGTPAFVETRVAGFLSEAPQAIELSQNFPNPTHGLTRILFSWPASQGLERHAVLQILDTRGRELRKIPLKHIQVGRQEMTLDFTHWKPGIYLYRLTVLGDGRTTRLQKRMLIAP